VINDGLFALTTGRKIMLILALMGVGYLFMQTRTAPVQISSWSGKGTNPFAASAAGAIAQPQGIAGEAAPQSGRGIADTDIPAINPLGVPNTVMTQGYGVGSHAPANIWGGGGVARGRGGGWGGAAHGPGLQAGCSTPHRRVGI
jgi:hypothetical protein